MVDHFLTGLATGLATNLGEKCRKTVVVVLTPFLKRMVMALGALDTGSEKELGRVLQLLLGGLYLAIPCYRRVVGHVTGGSENLAGKLIIWHVGVECLSYPAVECIITSSV